MVVQQPAKYACPSIPSSYVEVTFAGLLTEWAVTNGVRHVAVSPADRLREFADLGDCHMTILSVGSATVTVPRVAQLFKVARAVARRVPFVVTSDLDDSADCRAGGRHAGLPTYQHDWHRCRRGTIKRWFFSLASWRTRLKIRRAAR